MNTMAYRTTQPPFTLKFWEMSKKELKAYFEWFMAMIPERVGELADAVRHSPGFEDWRPDYTPDSLDALGEWFASQVETRPRTEEELQEIRDSSRVPVDIPREELTNRTFSLAMDVGMYLSQVLVRNHPELRWQQPLGGKTFVDYGQPVLVGSSPIPFNPVRLAVTLAYRFASESRTGGELREVYDIWSKKLFRKLDGGKPPRPGRR
jgi:hypothetical protein